jgi:hypothetical protein
MADHTDADVEQQQFGSDNYSGICPEAWAAMESANQGHATAYGDDPWTARAADAFRGLFETDGEVFLAFNGTPANSPVLASLCQSYHGVDLLGRHPRRDRRVRSTRVLFQPLQVAGSLGAQTAS